MSNIQRKGGNDVKGWLYLLHFDKPYWGKARHYVGITKLGVEKRIAIHLSGKGSLLVSYALSMGGRFGIGLVLEFDHYWQARQAEKKLKRGKNLPNHCRICKRNISTFGKSQTL